MCIFSRILKPVVFVLLIAVNLFLAAKVQGQATGDPQEDFLYGEYYLVQDLYQEALPFYLSALETNPDNSNINYCIGLCYMKIIGEQHNALPYLEKAVKEVDEHYIEGRYKNPAAPIEAWLLLGDAYHRENNLLQASFAYHQYKKLVENNDKQKYEMVMQKITNLGISSEFQRFKNDVRIINLGATINSRFSDYNPVLSGDQMTMVYTQYWETFDNVMITHRIPEGWTTPVSINDPIGSQGNCYTSALSFDGTELFLIWHDAMDYDIYVTYFRNGEWTKMEPLPGKVNSRYPETSVSISADGYFMYFSSNRPGGEGGFDIYRAERKGNEWVDVQNLGKAINTVNNEEAPYITYDGTTLYFSSNGHETVGNMDILYSELDDAGNWTSPVNIGLPVNTTNDDIFYMYFPDTKSGYMARDLTDGYGKNDLYRVQTGNDPHFTFNTKTSEIDGSSIKNDSADESSGGNIPKAEKKDRTSQKSDKSDKSIVQTSSDDNNIEYVKSEDTIYNDQNNTVNSIIDAGWGNTDIPTSATQKYGYVPDYSIPADSIPTYTIQLYALQNRIDPQRIKFSPLIVSKGNDGLHRYTYGEYRGYSKALEQLDSVRRSGFPDAFIRNIDTVQNYTGNGRR